MERQEQTRNSIETFVGVITVFPDFPFNFEYQTQKTSWSPCFKTYSGLGLAFKYAYLLFTEI